MAYILMAYAVMACVVMARFVAMRVSTRESKRIIQRKRVYTFVAVCQDGATVALWHLQQHEYSIIHSMELSMECLMECSMDVRWIFQWNFQWNV